VFDVVNVLTKAPVHWMLLEVQEISWMRQHRVDHVAGTRINDLSE